MSTVKDLAMFENYGEAFKWKNEKGEDMPSDETSSYYTFGADQGIRLNSMDQGGLLNLMLWLSQPLSGYRNAFKFLFLDEKKVR